MAENTIIHEISLDGYKAASTGGMLDLGTWGSYGIEKLHLTLDAAWQDLTITAFFNVKGEVVAKKVVGKDGYADVPWEATKENTFAGRIVFEGSMNGQRRISANLNYKVTNHSEITDSDPVPTDDRWNQFVTENKEYRDGAFEAAERSNARAEDAEAASDDAQAAARAAKASENAAKASENAAAASEDNARISAGAAAVSEGNAAASADKAKASETAAAESEKAAAKSAADADSTANSIKDSMAQISENKEAVSQLEEDLADYEDVLDIKLYKASLAESAPGIGPNWNLYYDMSIPAGTKVSVTLNSYSGTLFINMSVRFFDANGNMKNYGSIKSIGGTMVITTTDDYTRLWLQINRSGIENGVNASITFATNRSGVFKALTDLENTLNKKINEEILKASIVHTFHVEKDGTGDFTKLIDAIDEAEKYMDSVVYVGDGKWDIIDELGSDYVNSVSFTQRGIVLKNRIKIVFASKSKVICNYSGDNTTTMNWLSPFNAGENGFTLENLNIYSRNVRYSVHDERNSSDDFYINRYINCHFFNYNENGGFRQCIGGGLGKNGYIVIENCIFENPKASNNSLVSYHNTANVGGGSAKSNIEVSNCYVKGTGTLRFSWYGTSTDTTIVKATGNNLGSAIQFVAETSDGTSPNENVELYEWNNIIRSH